MTPTRQNGKDENGERGTGNGTHAVSGPGVETPVYGERPSGTRDGDGGDGRGAVGLMLVVFGLVGLLAAVSMIQPEWFKPRPQAPVQTVQIAQRNIGPAPKVKRGAARIVKGRKIMSWVATGAGDESYNGVYEESGTYNGKPAYTNGSRWLWWADGDAWWLTEALGGSQPTGYFGNGPDLPACPWSLAGMATSPAPNVSEGAFIRLGGSLADAALWDDAAKHRYSKWGPLGGYQDVDADEESGWAPALPYQFQAPALGAGASYTIIVKVNGHTWATKTGLAGGESVQSGTIEPGGSGGLPYSEAAGDAWDGYLGSAGSQAITLELRKSDGTLVATDTGAYTMFCPALQVSTDPAGTVPDRFDVTVAWDEWHGGTAHALLTVYQEGTDYHLAAYNGITGGLHLATAGTTPVVQEVDLAFIYTSIMPEAMPGLTPGAFVLRAWQADVSGRPGPVPRTDTALTHVETYEIQIVQPEDGATVGTGSIGVTLFLAQGPRFGYVSVNGDEPPSWQYGSRFLAVTIPASTVITANWWDNSSGDVIILATDSISLIIEAGDGGTGGVDPETGAPEPPPGPEPTTPWVWLYHPPEGATVAAAFTATINYGNYSPTTAGHLKIVAVGPDVVTLYDGDVVLAAAGQLIVALDLGAAAEGAYTLYITLTGTGGEAASDTAALTYAAGGSGDTTAPTVEIVAPAAGASVSGRVTVRVAATDAGGIWRVMLQVDGMSPQTLYAPGSDGLYTFVWDSRTWANGTHVLTATARDLSGNAGSDAVTVNLVNAQADCTLDYWTEQLGTDADNVPLNAASAAAGMSGVFVRGQVLLVPLRDLPTDPRLLRNVQVAYNAPGVSHAWGDATVIGDIYHSFPIVPAGSRSWRVLMRGTPLQQVASWPLTATAAIRLAAGEEWMYVLATGPAQIRRIALATGAISEFGATAMAGLGSEPVDLALVAGKVIVAQADRLLVLDEDSGELAFELALPAPDEVEAVTALAADGEELMVAATLTAGGSRVYRFSWERLTAVADHEHTITALAKLGATVWAGNDAGEVLTLGASALTLDHATGEAVVRRLAAHGALLVAGTGEAGKLLRKGSGWTQIGDFGWDAVRGLGQLDGWLWAGGTGTGGGYLWCERNEGWVQSVALDGATGVYDLAAAEANGAQQLFVAAATATGAAVYRVEIAAAGQFLMADKFPDHRCAIVRSVQG